YLLGSAAILLLLAVPLLDMRLAMPDASTAEEGSTRREAHALLVEGFGAGFSGPLVITVDVPSAGGEAALADLRDAVVADPAVAQVPPAVPSAAGDTAVLQVTPTGSPQDESTEALVHRLRDDVLPASLEGTDGTALVGGVS